MGEFANVSTGADTPGGPGLPGAVSGREALWAHQLQALRKALGRTSEEARPGEVAVPARPARPRVSISRPRAW